MKTKSFKAGDLVKIIRNDIASLNPFSSKENSLYKVSEFVGDKLKLQWLSFKVSLQEVSPIPINGEDDRNIYLYNANVTAVVDGQEDLYHLSTDVYYIDYLKSHKENWNELVDLIEQGKIKFVHEVQQYLREHDFSFSLKTT